MGNSNPTQCERVLSYLKEYGSINALQAMRDLGVWRLASRISELRQDHDIEVRRVKVTNRFAETTQIAEYHVGKNFFDNLSDG